MLGGIAGRGCLIGDREWPSRIRLSGGFASNGYAAHSPGGYSLVSCFVAEVVLTFFFLMIIMGATDRRAPSGFAPIAIGLGLTLIHLIGIPVTNLSVNPARSTGPAIFVGGWALAQLWLFWVAPIIGGLRSGERCTLRSSSQEPQRRRPKQPARPKQQLHRAKVIRPRRSSSWLSAQLSIVGLICMVRRRTACASSARSGRSSSVPAFPKAMFIPSDYTFRIKSPGARFK